MLWKAYLLLSITNGHLLAASNTHTHSDDMEQLGETRTKMACTLCIADMWGSFMLRGRILCDSASESNGALMSELLVANSYFATRVRVKRRNPRQAAAEPI